MKGTDRSRLEEVMAQYKQLVYSTAVTQLGSISDAEDVFQEVFLLYYRKAPEFPNEKAQRSWLIRTTLNKCRQLRADKWRVHVDKDAEPEQAVEFSTKEENQVWQAVMALDEKYRMPVWLRYFQEMSVEDIGAALGLRPNAVSVRLNRARKILRKKLEGDYFYEE